MQWRLRLDTAITMATTPGLIRSVHSSDFSQREGVHDGTWRDPVSRLLWLRPNWLDRGYYSNLRGLSSFRVQTSAVWRPITRSPDGADLMALVHPYGWSVSDIALSGISTYLPTIDASPSAGDDLKWALQSSGWQLAADEGFVIYYHDLTDELVRRNNWMAIQWGRLLLHMSGSGEVRLYHWDADTPMTDAPTLEYRGNLCGPGQQMARTGYLAVTPIPGMGIALHYPQVQLAAPQQQGSVEAAVGHGLLLPFPAENAPGTSGWPVIAEAGPLTIALNPYVPHVIGVQQTRYPSSGLYTDGWFDTAVVYEDMPTAVTPTLMPRWSDTTSSVTGALLGSLGTWAPGIDRMARVRLQLTTGDTKYTPFVLGYTVEWPPRYTMRGTTELEPDYIERIEWSTDARLRSEGTAELYLRAEDARTVAERGDCTFELEYSDDGSTWTTALAGWARHWQIEASMDNAGVLYRARCTLKDYSYRMEEVHVNLQTAFDWMSVADAVDNVLKASSMPPVIAQSAELQNIIVPGSPTGSSWRYAPNLGDSGKDALDAVLLHARAQNTEWILRYDYDQDGWVTEKRNASTTTDAIELVTTKEEEDRLNGIYCYETLRLEVEPPEANVVQVFGLSDPDSGGVRYVSPPCTNLDSISDASSADYLGRVVLLLGTVAEAPSRQVVNLMARRLYDAVAHRRQKATVTLTDWDEGLKPNCYATLNIGSSALELWVKRVTVTIDGAGPSVGATVHEGYHERVTLELDSVWETEWNA